MTTTTSHRGYLKASGGEHVDISVIDAALDAIDADVYTEINARTAADALAALKANNLSDLASAATARTNLGLGSAATQPSSAFDAAGAAAAVTPTSIGAVGVGDTTWLTETALAQAFRMNGAPTYDATYGTLTASNIKWPDGTTGAYATTSLDGNGAPLGFTATYVGATTKTVSVTIPRNASGQVSASVTVAVA